MTGHGAKFPRKKEEAIAALLTRPSVEEAARTIGIEPKTLRRWMRVPEFRAAYLQARREGGAQAVARMQQGGGGAACGMVRLDGEAHAVPALQVRRGEC